MGTGLGLSIVRQIIDTNGGKVEISSDPGLGTKLTIKLALPRPESNVTFTPEREQYLSYLPRLEGRKICILHKEIQRLPDGRFTTRSDEGLLCFIDALAMTLEKHLHMEVIETTEWADHGADIVICPEVSFDYLKAIRSWREGAQRAPVTVFVAMDALEAAALRSDVRVTDRESVVEIITQP